MTFEIEVAGRIRRVSVDPVGSSNRSGGRFQITLDAAGTDGIGRRQLVDARRTNVGWSIVYEHDRRVVDVAVTERPRGDMLVELPHVTIAALVDGRRFRSGDAIGADAGAGHVVAPMPGRVVRVLVAAGDEVSARQGLVVVEAMKMENELTASRAGRVAEVTVVEGQSVEAGLLLIRLE
jgi:biotin carboxyl carrier protein